MIDEEVAQKKAEEAWRFVVAEKEKTKTEPARKGKPVILEHAFGEVTKAGFLLVYSIAYLKGANDALEEHFKCGHHQEL